MAQTIKKSSSWDESERRSHADVKRAVGAPSSSFAPVVSVAPQSLDEAFPVVDPNFEPMGSLVLLQIMVAKATTAGGIDLPDEVRSTIQQNTQVAKVLTYGPLAFKNRNTGADWPEGAWVQPGDYVRVPRLSGTDRFEVRYGDGVVQFMIMKDLELPGRIPRPLEAIAYV